MNFKKGSLIDIFIQNKLLKNNIFSFDLNKQILNFGQVKINNTYHFVDVFSDNNEYNFWKLELKSFIIGEVDLCSIYNSRGEK